jgi:two-component system OmpR family response regulator
MIHRWALWALPSTKTTPTWYFVTGDQLLKGAWVRVLVVEDHLKTSTLLERGLREHAYAVDVARTGQDAVWSANQFDYDVAILDLMLPDFDGFEVIRQIRSAGRRFPVLVLTARDSVDDRVRGLDAGADDYLSKPFAFKELLARLRALTRRGSIEGTPAIVVGDLHIDPASRSVRRGDIEVRLTRKEFALLELLALKAGKVVPRQLLLEHVWDSNFLGESNVLDVFIRSLRQKVDAPFGCQSIETIRGHGYRLQPVQGHAHSD